MTLGRRIALVAFVAAISGLFSAPANAQTPDPEGPVLVYQNIEDGSVLDELPLLIQLCFADPINVKDLDKGGEFSFEVTQPDGIGLGHRDIFQPDGYGVAVQPGNPVGDNLNGEWTFRFRVTTPDAQHAAEGEINYTLDPQTGQPAPRVSPPACVASGGTATVSPPPGTGEPTPAVTGSTPTLTAAPSASPTPKADTPMPVITRGPEEREDGDGPDIVEIVLITFAVVGGLAVLAVIGYFVRRAIGYDPHRPGPGSDSGHH